MRISAQPKTGKYSGTQRSSSGTGKHPSLSLKSERQLPLMGVPEGLIFSNPPKALSKTAFSVIKTDGRRQAEAETREPREVC